MGSGSRLSGLLIAAVICLAAAGCQHSPLSNAQQASEAWRVMERVGDVRMVKDGGGESSPLRPGEAIADNRQVTTSEGSLLILSRNGFQLTAGENTSFRLPAREATSGLFLDHGWLRVRLEKPVDQEMRIKTAEFDINASRAMLTLRATSDGTNLTVEAGSAILATTDGRHRATLTAGAAAKMNPASGDDLLIQPASGKGFTRASPLPAAGQRKDGNLAILPASRKKKPFINRLEAPTPGAKGNASRAPAISPPIAMGPPRSSAEKNLIPSSMPEVGQDRLPAALPFDQRIDDLAYDTLQLQFDRLTEGLVDGL